MTEMSFNEEDKQKFIEFLNTVAKHAEFKLNTVELVQYFKLLQHMQGRILPKLEANILEVLRVVEAEKAAEKDSTEAKKRK